MKVELRPALAALLTRAQPLFASYRAHRFWLEWGAVVALLVLAAVLTGSAARERAAAAAARAAELEGVLRRMTAWERGLQPPTPAESLTWRMSQEQIRFIAGDVADPLQMARRVAERAEQIGVYDVRIARTDADTLVPPPEEVVGAWSLRPDEAGLVVGFTGDLGSLANFIGALPPQVQVGSVEAARVGGEIRSRVFLFTRTLAPTDGT